MPPLLSCMKEKHLDTGTRKEACVKTEAIQRRGREREQPQKTLTLQIRLDLELITYRPRDTKFTLFKPPHLWYFAFFVGKLHTASLNFQMSINRPF